MAHFVNQFEDGSYQAARKSTGRYLYEVRTPTEGVTLDKARVFNTRGAAKNASHGLNVATIEVELVSLEEVE